MSDTSQLERVFNFLEVSGGASFSSEGEAPEDRRSQRW